MILVTFFTQPFSTYSTLKKLPNFYGTSQPSKDFFRSFPDFKTVRNFNFFVFLISEKFFIFVWIRRTKKCSRQTKNKKKFSPVKKSKKLKLLFLFDFQLIHCFIVFLIKL